MLEHIAYSASRTFFGGFLADENLAANMANGVGVGSSGSLHSTHG